MEAYVSLAAGIVTNGEMMKNIFLFLTLSFTSIAFAGSHGKGMHSEGHGSDGKYTVTYEILDNSWNSGVNTVVGATLDEDDSGYGIVLGYDLGNHLMIEAGYKDFGEASLSGVSGNTFNYGGASYTFDATANAVFEADSLSIGLKKSFSIADNISAFGRIGIHRWEANVSAATATASADSSSKNEDMYYGYGIAYEMGNISLNLSRDKYDLEYDEVDSTAFSLSYNLAF
ncbi:outer membrane beta-barrel protein [Gammaproteobacteria bacterium]|nr:outer membrane beta-barrel protein [Gammaproteobacteria bacterium]